MGARFAVHDDGAWLRGPLVPIIATRAHCQRGHVRARQDGW
jgi:hypothetical protein